MRSFILSAAKAKESTGEIYSLRNLQAKWTWGQIGAFVIPEGSLIAIVLSGMLRMAQVRTYTLGTGFGSYWTGKRTLGQPWKLSSDDQKMNGKNNRNLKGFLSARDRNWGPDRASPLLKVTTLTSGVQGTTALHRLLSQSWIQSLWTLLFCNRKWNVPTEPAIICNMFPFTLSHYETDHRCVNNGEGDRWVVITQSSLSEVEALWF